MPKLTPNLWFDKNAEEAARFYVSIFPNSRVTNVNRSPADFPSGKAGDVVTVDWELDGQPFTGINGGTDFQFNESISFLIDCKDQAEVDRYWDALLAGRRRAEHVRLAEGSVRRLVAGRAAPAERADRRLGSRRREAGDGGDARPGQARRRRAREGLPRRADRGAVARPRVTARAARANAHPRPMP